MATPTEKMTAVRTIDHRLPRKSATGPTDRAPRNAPADKVETTRDCWDEVMAHCPVEGLGFPKVHSQSRMPWTPEIMPVS